MVRSIIRSVFSTLPVRLQNQVKFFYNKYSRNAVIRKWRSKGDFSPPPHPVKQLAIEHYSHRYTCKTLVETGTYLGDMVLSQKNNFLTIYSIEIAPKLWERAVVMFAAYPYIKILQGDSGQVLHQIIPLLKGRTVFWLDGHYSAGETGKGEKISPVFEELKAIFKQNAEKHIILIDDARLFVGEWDYPTLDNLKSFVKSLDSTYAMEVTDDIIRLTPGSAGISGK